MSVRVPRPLLFLPLAILAGCASGGAPRPGKAATPEVNALYDRMNQASKGYESSIDQARRGDTPQAAQTRKQALDQLKDASARCGLTPGCDPQRFAAVFDRLLRLKDGSFIEGEDADDTEQGAEVGAQPGDASGTVAVGTLPQAQRSVTMLRGQQFSDMMVMNGPVKAALEMWLTQLRPNLMDAYVNYQMMRYKMWPAYKKADLPEAQLFGIMAKESGGKVHAVSRAGASGPLQFMPATGYRFGLGRDGSGFDSRFDPQQSARANAAYINERFRELNRNLEFTIAAYNGGEGRAARLYGSSAGASYWSPQVMSQIPTETRDYVPAVIAAAWLFLHPKKYGLDFPRIDTTPGQFTVARATSINELTICLGNGGTRDGYFRVLRNLNPRYEASQAIYQGTVLRAPRRVATLYQRNCIQGPRAALAQELGRASREWAPVASTTVATPSTTAAN